MTYLFLQLQNRLETATSLNIFYKRINFKQVILRYPLASSLLENGV